MATCKKQSIKPTLSCQGPSGQNPNLHLLPVAWNWWFTFRARGELPGCVCRAQGLVRSTGAQPGPCCSLAWAASLSSSSNGSCLVMDRAVPCAHQLPDLNGAELLGSLAALKTSISVWVLSHTAVHPINLCAITPLQLRRNPPGHFCLLKEGFWKADCSAVLSKSKISVLSYNYLNTTISLVFLIYDI